MSTFRGIVEEFPGISVDRFEPKNRSSSTVFFLSHFHADHTVGLDSSFFNEISQKNQYIYCTPITKRFLVSLHDSFADNIKEISACNPIVINYTNPNVNISNENATEIESQISDLLVTVTAVPAGHCPGSIMFLFEAHKDNNDITVLCTGDFRINPDDFPKLKPLHIKVNSKLIPKTFDNIYLDTTFYDENLSYLPDRQEAVGEIVKIVEDWLAQSPDNFVVIEISANYGSEELFDQLSSAINQRIHVKDHVAKNYRYIPEASRYTTEDPNDTRIHACMPKFKRGGANSPLTCRPQVKAENILTVVPSVWRWKGKDLRQCCDFDRHKQKYFVCYSCHASYGELKAFIDYFKPRKIHPCVLPDVNYKNAWQMQSQTKFEEFSKLINEAHLREFKESSKGEKFECDFMEYTFLKRRPQTDHDSDDSF